MINNYAVKLHAKLKGKIAVVPKINLKMKKNLSLAYTPGVGAAVEYIKRNKKEVYRLTGKNNAVAVVTDGSAVLGLGNVGPAAALPVMEGKCAIFKEFADIDAYPICLATQNVDEIVQTIQNISPGFGGINLEDISAPRCFEIEKKLQEVLDIPVMHDDQHATAIIVLAGIFNASKIVDKALDKCKIVVVGCGAAGTAIIKLLANLPVGDIIALDREGILSPLRKNLPAYKKEIVSLTNKENLTGGLKEAVRNADILIGVSVGGLFTESIIRSMVENPIVFALANPNPEVIPNDAKKWGVKIIATGRSDYPNQINNALVFPGFFKGLLTNKLKRITSKMKIKTAKALASLVKNPSENYFIPSIFDRRVVTTIIKSLSGH